MARETKKTGGVRWRLWLGLGAVAVVCAGAGYAVLKTYEFLLSNPQFTLSRDRKDALMISGVRYAPGWKVARVFAGDWGRSIFSVGLAERRRRLLGIDWVEDASVSRIWPDRLVVRIRERKPVAFAALRSGTPMLIDAEGVLLEQPAKAQFSFPVLSGINEDENDDARREKVRAFLRFEQEMGKLTKDISEIDSSRADDIRVIARVENRAVELRMGDSDFARRYQAFLNYYPEIFKRSPDVSSFDLRLPDRITAKE